MSWQKRIALADIKDGEFYILARPFGTEHYCSYWYWSQPLRGKANWTVKPGLAIHAGAEGVRKVLQSNPCEIVGWKSLLIGQNGGSKESPTANSLVKSLPAPLSRRFS